MDSVSSITGILHVPIEEVKSSRLALGKVLTEFGSNRGNQVMQELYKGNQFECELCWHVPYVEEGMIYDVINSLKMIDREKARLAEFKEWFFPMKSLARDLEAEWLKDETGISLFMGARRQRDVQKSDEAEGSIGYINIQSNLFHDGQSVENQALGEKLKDTFCSIVHKDQEFDPNNFWRTNLDWPTAMSLFDQCVAGISDIFGETTLFRLACNYHEVITKFQGKLPESVPKVWDYWKVIFMPKKGFDPLSTPKDASIVRVYPLVLLKHSHHPIRMHSEEYLCGLNCVHAHGKSYVEIQACDVEWLKLVADFFGAPIDVWEGPLEDRFGWYGDVSKGTTYRLEPKTSKTFVSQLESVFVAAPKRIWLCRDGKERDAPEIYRRPHVIASSLEALQNAADAKGLDLYGDKDPGLLLGGAFGEFSAEQFDWFQYPTEVQDKARKLAGIKPDENFVQQMEKKWDQLRRTVQIEMVKLLNIAQYRITELSLSKEDRAKLEKALASKRVTRATDNWIASLLNQTGEWEIMDHHYEPSYDSEDGAAFY